jgi:V/A-type H+-transporting ATPase subunit E
MEIQVQELIDKIKRDGIETASEEAARLKAQSEAEAKRIVEAAQKQAADIIAKGKQDAERFEKAGTAALQQASRNLVLAFKGEIQGLLDKIAAEETEAVYGDDVLKEALPEILKAWAGKPGDLGLDLLLSEEECKKLKGWFTTKLSAKLKNGVELKSDRNLGAGFKIAQRDGSAYYDFSAEAVAELLSQFLNPHVAEILKAGVAGAGETPKEQ